MAEIEDRPAMRPVARCRRCHGWLLSPQSIAEGIGPTCAVRERIERCAATAAQPALFDIAA
ncbi:DUF6011 domain-containing protein [Nocardia paucivorans]|uniref:DUF6011 domain-containing protein n=1 Tax=Nocardia paucivorans TaxID=114259 RepID=UPI0003178165|nr:DUF6011 domain-containing protein [Nocardia paucivorans]